MSHVQKCAIFPARLGNAAYTEHAPTVAVLFFFFVLSLRVACCVAIFLGVSGRTAVRHSFTLPIPSPLIITLHLEVFFYDFSLTGGDAL